jgi:hypothetical protein
VPSKPFTPTEGGPKCVAYGVFTILALTIKIYKELKQININNVKSHLKTFFVLA